MNEEVNGGRDPETSIWPGQDVTCVRSSVYTLLRSVGITGSVSMRHQEAVCLMLTSEVTRLWPLTLLLVLFAVFI